MRAFPPLFTLFFLAATALADPAPKAPGCDARLLRSLRAAERQLGASLNDERRIFNYPQEITAEEIVREEQRARARLEERGFPVQPLNAAGRKPLGLQTGLEIVAAEGYVKAPPGGERGHLFPLLLGTQHRAPAWASGPGAPVLFHRELPDMVRRLHTMGVAVYLDATLYLVDYDGVYDGPAKALLLEPDAPYHALVHETAHAEFHYHHVPEFLAALRAPTPGPLVVEALALHTPWAGFGLTRLLRVAELARAGYPEIAIDERMAVEAEIPLLDRDGVIGRAARAAQEAYADLHLLTSLAAFAQGRELLPAERATFRDVLTRYLRSRPEERPLCRLARRYGRLLERAQKP